MNKDDALLGLLNGNNGSCIAIVIPTTHRVL